MNIFAIQGRVVADPELKQAGQTPVANFSIGWNNPYIKDKDKQGNFFDCKVFGKKAETLCEYAKKGMLLSITGSLTQDRWKDNDGGNRSKVVLVVNDFTLPPKGASAESTPTSEPVVGQTMIEEDVPF